MHEPESDGFIDIKKIADSEENEKKQSVFKLLFKGTKKNERQENTDDRPIVDAYAKKQSDRFGTVSSVLWVALTLFVVLFLTFFGDKITTGSMQRAFRDMLGRGETQNGVSEYYFSINDNASFGSLSGIPIIAGSDRVVIFAPDGTHQYSDESIYSLPKLETSGDYAIIYDRAGNSFGVYDSLGVKYTEKEGNAIYSATVSDSGSFAVARHGNDYTSEIKVYTPDMKVRNLIKKNNRVASMDMNGKTGEIALLTYSVTYDGRVESELMILDTESDAPKKIINLEEGLPIECRYLDNGNIVILFEDFLTLVDANGKTVSSRALDCGDMHMYKLSDTGALVYAKRIADNSERFSVHTVLMSENSVKSFDLSVDGGLVGLNISKETAYIITESSAVSVNMSSGKDKKVYNSSEKLKYFIEMSDETYACFATSIKKAEMK